MSISIGPLQIDALIAGRFSLDGGVAFGVAPRLLWEGELSPDEKNRVSLVARVLLIRSETRSILVDVGPGQRWDEKPRELYAIDPKVSLGAALQEIGVQPEDISDVVISHLHWDHAAGLSCEGTKGPELSFPNATHHLQRRHWKWAHSPAEYDRRAYRAVDLDLLEASGQLHFVEGHTELIEGVTLLPCEGHTVGQQLVRIEGEGESLLYCGDAIPTASHLAPSWGLAYDLYPLTVIEEKKQLLAGALEDGGILCFAHDPRLAACRLAEIGGRIQVSQEVKL